MADLELLTDDELHDAQVRASREDRILRIRERSAAMIANIIHANREKSEIESWLAIGQACPFTAKWDCAIWAEEAVRLMEGK